MDAQKSTEIFRLFDGKADKLDRSRFMKEMVKNSGFRISGGIQQPTVAERLGPDEEAIDAMILTLRFFISDKEPISIRRIAELYETLPLDEELKQQFRETRELVNDLLAQKSIIMVDGAYLTNRDIFEVFIYGDLAHTNNRDRRGAYEAWAQNPLAFPLLSNAMCRYQSVSRVSNCKGERPQD